MTPDHEYTGRAHIRLYHADCMDFLAECAPDEYELAIVDPPYGRGEDKTKRPSRGRTKTKDHKPKNWDDKPPDKIYFNELFRVSNNQIVWGGIYMTDNLYPNSGWVVWDKKTVGNTADCELAWSSFKCAAKLFEYLWEGFWQQDMKNKEQRIHPTQKPVALYKWLLQNYAQPGDRILDTHGGSLSLAIACWELGFDADIIELDEDYFAAAVERFEQHIQQLHLFP